MDSKVWQSQPVGNFSDCPNGSQWVWDVFNECAQDGWDIASIVLGLVSIVCFAAASFPQYYQACKTGNMDEALSIYFLLGWLAGDSFNLIGSFLADQLPLQTYTAIYYVSADLIMLSLYCYYKVRNQSRGFLAPINAVFAFIFLGTVSTTSLLGGGGSLAQETMVTMKGRTLLSAAVDESGHEFKRKSTAGVSYSLFALVMLGNTLYGASVLLKNPDPGQTKGDYALHHLPWLIGSLGVLSLDIGISFQFLAYRNRRPSTREEREALLSS
ncbi:lysosomal amino acid transporter 1 homolog isoform X2 [Alligator sinensis]|uniref:Lysosomal amino acid transporter 1 homolog isoform X2 n=1 Tax=Alligator sinensis TaxID=38654 RepID=A0A3Q0HEK0_ALLSI|nr:lysosomal amino acid transporter 1 homolog isoform X2 [Alligator sinensis]